MALTTNEVRVLRLLAGAFESGVTLWDMAREVGPDRWPAVQKRLGPLVARGLIFRGRGVASGTYYISDDGSRALCALEAT